MPTRSLKKALTVPRAALLAIMSMTLLDQPALSQTGQKQPVQTCQLGELKLESGEVISNFRMTYITFGTLNDAKSNAILSLHGLQGNRNNRRRRSNSRSDRPCRSLGPSAAKRSVNPAPPFTGPANGASSTKSR